MLGIIANLNDLLQGRKSDDFKTGVLKGLKELILQVGQIISTVAPQVTPSVSPSVPSKGS